jgi:hypothetical protein
MGKFQIVLILIIGYWLKPGNGWVSFANICTVMIFDTPANPIFVNKNLTYLLLYC